MRPTWQSRLHESRQTFAGSSAACNTVSKCNGVIAALARAL